MSYQQQQRLLEDFVTKSDDKSVTPELEQILSDIAKTGLTCNRWDHLKQLIAYKLTQTVSGFSDFSSASDGTNPEENPTGSLHGRIDKALTEFPEPPFTLQRICELILQPQKHYKTAKKFLFAFEKLVTVSITNESLSLEEYEKAIEEQEQLRKQQQQRQQQSSEENNKVVEGEIAPADFDPVTHAVNRGNSNNNNNLEGKETDLYEEEPYRAASTPMDLS